MREKEGRKEGGKGGRRENIGEGKKFFSLITSETPYTESTQCLFFYHQREEI